jgi:hypothetical protein
MAIGVQPKGMYSKCGGLCCIFIGLANITTGIFSAIKTENKNEEMLIR